VLLTPSRADATVVEKSEEVYHGYSGSWKHCRELYGQGRTPDRITPKTAQGQFGAGAAGTLGD
jgi:hypothetical protein